MIFSLQIVEKEKEGKEGIPTLIRYLLIKWKWQLKPHNWRRDGGFEEQERQSESCQISFVPNERIKLKVNERLREKLPGNEENKEQVKQGRVLL